MSPLRRLFNARAGRRVATLVTLVSVAVGVALLPLPARVPLLAAAALAAWTIVRGLRAESAVLRECAASATRLARVDELTSLPNRRAFQEALPNEVSRARRWSQPLCLAIAELDGPPAGDDCVRQAADALREELRQHDACFRWDGDAFAVLLPGTTRTEADAACVRLATAVAMRCRRTDGTPLSLACAAAQLTDGMTGGDLVGAAAAALRARQDQRRPRLRALPGGSA